MKALLLTAFLFSSFSHAATIRLKVADNHSKDYPTVQALEHMKKLLKADKSAKLKLKVFHSGQLGQEKDVIELVKSGAISMARVSTASLNGIAPETQVICLPYIFRSKDHMNKVLYGDVGDRILKSLENHGLIGITFFDTGSRSIYNSKRPITKIEDLKNLKVRVMGSDIAIALMEELGASATAMNFSEVYAALQTGVVDGAENNVPSYFSKRHFESAKYYSKTDHLIFPEILIMSPKVWNKMSDEQKTKLKSSAGEAAKFMTKAWEEYEKKSLDKLKAAGVQINELNKSAFIEKASGIYPKFVKSEKLKRLIKDIQAIK